MNTFLIIYLVGLIVCFVLIILCNYYDDDVTISDIARALTASFFSWISAWLVIVEIVRFRGSFGDKVIIRQKGHKKDK